MNLHIILHDLVVQHWLVPWTYTGLAYTPRLELRHVIGWQFRTTACGAAVTMVTTSKTEVADHSDYLLHHATPLAAGWARAAPPAPRPHRSQAA